MPWNKITLPFARVVAGDADRLTKEIELVFTAAGSPKDAAVFGNFDEWEESHFFFNPRASEIAADLIERWGGGPWSDPGEPVALVVGHNEAYFAQNPSGLVP